jgi:hypothetical protein
MTPNERVAFVAGAGHSGSTLLGIMMGAHPSVFYAGEARKSSFFGDLDKPLKKRACRLCGEACPVWSRLAEVPGDDLYARLCARTGRPVVLDSTKNVPWIEENAARVRASGRGALLLLLQRDGRAVVASRRRKYPERPVCEHAAAWREQIEASRALAARFSGPVLDVRYERVARGPERELERAAVFLGLSFVPAMLAPWTTEQHPLGGNSGTEYLLTKGRTTSGLTEVTEAARAHYAAHPRAIVLDERWRSEMSEADLAEFEREAGEANHQTAWEAA